MEKLLEIVHAFNRLNGAPPQRDNASLLVKNDMGVEYKIILLMNGQETHNSGQGKTLELAAQRLVLAIGRTGIAFHRNKELSEVKYA